MENRLHVAVSRAVGLDVSEFVKAGEMEKVEERMKIIAELLGEGLDPNGLDDMGFLPIHACILSSTAGSVVQFKRVIGMLLQNGVDIDVRDKTPKGFAILHYACAILHSGEYCDSKDQDHVLDVVRVLVETYNAKLDVGTKEKGMLPIHFAAERGHIKVLQYIIENNSKVLDVAMINVPDSEGNTPLHHAAMKQNDSMMEWMIANHANPNITNESQESPQALYDRKPKILYELEYLAPPTSYWCTLL